MSSAFGVVCELVSSDMTFWLLIDIRLSIWIDSAPRSGLRPLFTMMNTSSYCFPFIGFWVSTVGSPSVCSSVRLKGLSPYRQRRLGRGYRA